MDQRIERVLNYIENNLSKQHTLQSLSRLALMSSTHFHKVFKQSTGTTPFRFVETIKMQYAHEQILSGSTGISLLADQLGYQDYETFSRAFKKHYKLSPDDLKAIAKKIKIQTNNDNLLVKVFEMEESESIEEVMQRVLSHLRKLVIDLGYSEEDLREAKILSILPNAMSKQKALATVKNKFSIREDRKLWWDIINYQKQ